MSKHFIPPERYRHPFMTGLKSKKDVLHLQWLGTAGFKLRYKRTTLLIDPYFSRTGVIDLITKPLTPDLSQIEGKIEKADHIVIGHSHYDHILDVPEIASQTGAHVWGSSTTSNVCTAYGLPAGQVSVIEAMKPIKCGYFEVRFIPSLHGKIWGIEPAPGEVPAGQKAPMRFKNMKHGGVYGLHIQAGPHSLYHNGSANLIDKYLKKLNADIHLIGLSGRTLTKHYLQRLYTAIKPKYIIPMHYDHFLKPTEKPMVLLPAIKMNNFFADMERIDPNVKIVMAQPFENVLIGGTDENPQVCLAEDAG